MTTKREIAQVATAPAIQLDTDVPLGKPSRQVQGLNAHLRALKAADAVTATGNPLSFWYATDARYADRTIRNRAGEIGLKVAIRLEPHGDVRGYRVFRVEEVGDGK